MADDEDGSYDRLMIRLATNDLNFIGKKVAKKKTALDRISEYMDKLQSEGYDISKAVVPTGPIEYSELVLELEAEGLLKPVSGMPKSSPSHKSAEDAESEKLLSDEFSKEVNSLMNQDMFGDGKTATEDSGFSDGPVYDPMNESASLFQTQDDYTIDPSDFLERPDSSNNNDDRDRIKRLEAENARLRSRVIQLENQISAGEEFV